jgi:hypothetical protein
MQVDSDEVSAESSGVEEPNGESKQARLKVQPRPRRSARSMKLAQGAYREDDDEAGEGLSAPSMAEAGNTVEAVADVDMSGDGESAVAGVDEMMPPPPLPVKTESQDSFMAPPPIPGRPEMAIDINEDDLEEDKPKPILQLKYKGFDIAGRCLCVIVEPWPPQRGPSRAPSQTPFSRASTRAPSIAPADFVTSAQAAAAVRGRTPLFLPEDDENSRATPYAVPQFPQRRLEQPTRSLEDFAPASDSEDEDSVELMQFSRSLKNAGNFRTGEVDDDDELDGGVFFGDADEAREL